MPSKLPDPRKTGSLPPRRCDPRLVARFVNFKFRPPQRLDEISQLLWASPGRHGGPGLSGCAVGRRLLPAWRLYVITAGGNGSVPEVEDALAPPGSGR